MRSSFICINGRKLIESHGINVKRKKSFKISQKLLTGDGAINLNVWAGNALKPKKRNDSSTFRFDLIPTVLDWLQLRH